MKINILCCLLLLLTLASCKKVNESNLPEVVLGKIQDHIVTLEQAKQVAILQAIYPKATQKPSNKIELGKTSSTIEFGMQKANPIKTIKNAVGYKGNDSEVTFYIINFEGGGYTLVSADDRTIPILASSEKGEWVTNHIKGYPAGLKLWLDAVHDGIKYKRKFNVKQTAIAKAEWKDLEIKSKLTQGSTNTISDYPECLENGQLFYDFAQIGPLIGTMWGQEEGYNDSIPTSKPFDIITGPYTCYSDYSNGRPPTGCIATAIAQIMKYNSYPTGFFNWSSMGTGASPAVAQLMAYAGLAADMTYKCSGSYTPMWKIPNAFGVFGYSNADHIGSYNQATVISNLQNYKPVIIGGATDITDGGHAWVVEGLQEYLTYTCYFGDGPNGRSDQEYNRGIPPPGPGYYWVATAGYAKFYMNWGWQGVYDAWFSMDPNLWNPKSSPKGPYDYNHEMIYNITP